MARSLNVKCNVCGCKSSMPVNEALAITEREEGYIPCPKCGSHATSWSKKILEGK